VRQSSPYFLGLAVVSTVAVLAFRVLAVQLIGLYVLVMMELIALVTCAVIAVVRAGRLQSLVRTVAGRSFSPQDVMAGPATIYASVVSIAHTVVFFGVLSFAIWRGNASYFGGVSASSPPLYAFWQFVNNSFLTIVNNNGPLTEARFAAQVICDAERVIGIFLLVFVLGVLVSGWAEQAIRRSAFDGSSQPKD
jgi:hypothetical protein